MFAIIHDMKFGLAAAILSLGLVAGAAELIVSGLPASEFVDTEVSTNVVFSTGSSAVRTFTLSLELNAAVSNNVAVAFGRDADGNGSLDRSETDAVIGWDSGAWYWRDRRSGAETTVARTEGTKKLEALFTLDPRKQAKSIAARDCDGVVFTGRVPATMFDPDWDLMRVTARGVVAPNGIVVSRTDVYGFGVVVR